MVVKVTLYAESHSKEFKGTRDRSSTLNNTRSVLQKFGHHRLIIQHQETSTTPLKTDRRYFFPRTNPLIPSLSLKTSLTAF